MSINRYPRYVSASDELKAALVTYVHVVKMTAPELTPEVEKLMQFVFKQDVAIANFLRQRNEQK